MNAGDPSLRGKCMIPPPTPSSTATGIADATARTNTKQDVGNGKHFRPPQSSRGGGRRQRCRAPKNATVSVATAPSKTQKVNNREERPQVYRGRKNNQNLSDGRELLNFSYGPRPGRGRGSSMSHDMVDYHPPAKTNNYVRAKYNQEHYLQSNCQFIVKADGECGGPNVCDADKSVLWDSIEQIVMKTPAPSSCPICLSEPVAAKITKCGHIYCWSCLLHYLALSDDSNRKCPICQHSISKEDLKSVKTMVHTVYGVGDEIEMRLMIRQRTSLFAIPVDEYFPELNIKYPEFMRDEKSNPTYSQRLIIDPVLAVDTIVNREFSELSISLMEQENEPEVCFVEEAMKSLDIRRESLQLLAEARNVASYIGGGGVVASRDRKTSSSSLEATEEPKKSSSSKKENFFFYQSSDGQMIFLHGLNANMLEHQFHDLEYAPRSIKGVVVERESLVVTDDLRHKFRYLRHLPLSSNIEFIELDLSRTIDFGEDVLTKFMGSIEERKRRRQRRARDEEFHEQRIQNSKPVLHHESNVRISSEFHFPSNEHDFPSTLQRRSKDSPPLVSDNSQPQSPLSYSKVIRARPGTTTTTTVVRSDNRPILGAASVRSDDPGESYVPAPPVISFDVNEGVRVIKQKGKKKKKKAQSMILLSSAPRPQMD